MALAAAVLLRLARLGGSAVATLQPDGTAVAVHPAVETWYETAALDEDAAAWGTLYNEVLAAKTAHYCLMFPWNDDGIGRGLITEEPLAGNPGNRKYLHDYTDRAWWASTAPGALYLQLRSRIGASSRVGPILCT